MKKLFLLIISLVFTNMVFSQDATETRNKPMCIFDKQGYIYTFNVQNIDSILFAPLAPRLNIIPQKAIIYKESPRRIEIQNIAFPDYCYVNNVTWTVGNDSIASFNETTPSSYSLAAGEITGLRIGTTTLTATASVFDNNTNSIREYQATAEIEVRPMEISEWLNDENLDNYLSYNSPYEHIKFLHDHWGYFGFSELTTDEAVVPTRVNGDWNDGGCWRNIHNHTDYSVHTKNIYQHLTECISSCDKLIENLTYSSVSNAKKQPLILEYTILRDYYGYLMLDCFGSFCWQDGQEYVAGSLGTLHSAPVIWSRLVEDLERNADKLPVVTDANRSQYVGKVTQGFAYSLLARLYLNAESFGCTPQNIRLSTTTISSASDFYTNAIRCCDKVIQSNSYAIEDDYFTNFKIHNEQSRENIFVLVEDGSIGNERVQYNMSNKAHVQLLTLPYAMREAWNLIEMPWNGFTATESFINRFEYGKDLRGLCDTLQGTDAYSGHGWFAGPVKKDGTIVKDNMGTRDDVIITPHITSITNAGRNDGARMIKYEPDLTGTYRYMENDFVLFRYADVLYMKAEAVLRGGKGASLNTILADAEFRKIRQRAGVNYYTSLTLNELLDERGREFYWECVRHRDLVRFGKYNDASYIDYLENTADASGVLDVPQQTKVSKIEGIYINIEGKNTNKKNLGFSKAKNEVTYSYREGMFEKYIYLKEDDKFYFSILSNGKETLLGGRLAATTLPTDNYGCPAYRLEAGSVSLLNVPTGFYHIVYDHESATLVLVPVEWGVRGAMNGWGYTMYDEVSADGQTWTWKNVEITSGMQFKFSNGNFWKFYLNSDYEVSVISGLGKDLDAYGDNIIVAECGVYDIQLTFSLQAGEVSESFSYSMTKTSALDPSTFTVGISGSINGWADPSGQTLATYDAAKSNITDNTTKAGNYVFSLKDIFFPANSEFKFRINGDWIGLFDGLNIEGITATDHWGNICIAEKGVYNIDITLVLDGCSITSIKAAFTPGTPLETTTITITGTNLPAEWTEVAIYAWNGDSNLAGDWPGTKVDVVDGKVVYEFKDVVAPIGVIFNNNGGGALTNDITDISADKEINVTANLK
jgi:hypothetical protein